MLLGERLIDECVFRTDKQVGGSLMVSGVLEETECWRFDLAQGGPE